MHVLGDNHFLAEGRCKEEEEEEVQHAASESESESQVSHIWDSLSLAVFCVIKLC